MDQQKMRQVNAEPVKLKFVRSVMRQKKVNTNVKKKILNQQKRLNTSVDNAQNVGQTSIGQKVVMTCFVQSVTHHLIG